MGESAKIEACKRPGLTGIFSYLKNMVMLLRVAHWAKNLFLFLPLFFAGKLFDFNKLEGTFTGFVAFSLVASSIYIFNDYRDIEKDKFHPVKKYRVLASGKISIPAAFTLMIACLMMGLLIGWYCDIRFLIILAGYLLLNVAYSLGLKNVSIVDIMIIATGFILRVKGGGVISGVAISEYLMVMVFLLSLFLALSKRRDDILIKQASGKDMRKSVSGYNVEFLNMSIAVVSAIMIMTYLMYTLSPEIIRRMGTYRLYYTGIFVVAGLMRYMQLIYLKSDTRSPARILYKDRFIQVCLGLWVISFYLLIYFPNWHFYK